MIFNWLTHTLLGFKEKIKSTIATRVWEMEEMGEDDHMDKAKFRSWANKHPGLFSFLEELRDTLQTAVMRQKVVAARKIQRAYRRHKGTVYILGIVKPL